MITTQRGHSATVSLEAILGLSTAQCARATLLSKLGLIFLDRHTDPPKRRPAVWPLPAPLVLLFLTFWARILFALNLSPRFGFAVALR